MSRYAYLVCERCEARMFLGKAVARSPAPSEPGSGEASVDYFWRGDANGTNALDPQLSRALWKMLADHGQHGLCVVLEGTPEYEAALACSEIGGDDVGDVSFERYLTNWRG